MSITRYIEAIGRRKTATARVRITPSTKSSFLINEKEVGEYFPTSELRSIIDSAFTKGGIESKYTVTVHVSGSGIHSQAEAVRHGITRALVKEDQNLRSKLKKLGFLKRDPRAKERKKFGLKKARKAPTWSKR
jgi:small subunit ribosomal protein S9